jgi:hypothetical protein
LDPADEAVYAEAFRLAAAVHDFLNRMSTQRVIDAGLLDRDVVDELVRANDRMFLARTDRISRARRPK